MSDTQPHELPMLALTPALTGFAQPEPSAHSTVSGLIASWSVGPDSIGWAGLPHDPKWCISPPPFGKQCTLLRTVAMLACLRMPECVALTCPDPAESHIDRKPGITGPICQARRVRAANEKRHGMCRPGGCLNVLFRRNSMGEARRQGLIASLNSSSTEFRALAATGQQFGLFLVQPKPPAWLSASLQSSLLAPMLDAARGAVFALGGLEPRVGDGRRAKQMIEL